MINFPSSFITLFKYCTSLKQIDHIHNQMILRDVYHKTIHIYLIQTANLVKVLQINQLSFLNILFRYLNNRMILHEPFVNVEPLYTTMDIDLPRPLLLSSLQPSVLPEFTQRKQGPLSQIPLSFQQTNITKCCKRYIILCIYDKKNKM